MSSVPSIDTVNTELGNGTEQAIKYLQNKGINILGKSNIKGETVLFSDSWQKGSDDFITIKNK